ncbi:MAG: hypothetical protein IPP47_27640 [Bryobacterales bacterium]|nr:hypothetical protein [Bryobacterales bacterium]
MARATGLSSSDPIEKVRSAGHLAGEQILGLLRDRGWRVRQHRSYMPDGGAGSDDPSGVTLFTKSDDQLAAEPGAAISARWQARGVLA